MEKDDVYLDGNRYEPIANKIIDVMASHNVEFYEVQTLLDLVRLKCRHQNLGEPLEK